MNEYDYAKFRQALLERRTEVSLDLKRAEQRVLDLRTEFTDVQTALDNVEREHLRNNDKY